MQRVMVTGAGGYIGTSLVPMLLEQGYSVRAVDRFFFGHELLRSHPDLEMVREDVRRLTVSDFAGIDAVIDLAAISNDPSGELFQDVTWAVNHKARVRCAELAKQAGVKRYILPSSCSIYGFQPDGVIANEETPTNPLTTYAKANEQAEHGVLPLADDSFTVIVLRQATVYGYSPRMRLDLAINGMTYGAWKTERPSADARRQPVAPDGPCPRYRVSADLHADGAADKVDGRIFNVGSEANNYQLGKLAQIVVDTLPNKVEIEWYGDADTRSYRVSFDKIEALGWKAQRVAAGRHPRDLRPSLTLANWTAPPRRSLSSGTRSW